MEASETTVWREAMGTIAYGVKRASISCWEAWETIGFMATAWTA
jgi:hypothetical protein